MQALAILLLVLVLSQGLQQLRVHPGLGWQLWSFPLLLLQVVRTCVQPQLLQLCLHAADQWLCLRSS